MVCYSLCTKRTGIVFFSCLSFNIVLAQPPMVIRGCSCHRFVVNRSFTLFFLDFCSLVLMYFSLVINLHYFDIIGLLLVLFCCFWIVLLLFLFPLLVCFLQLVCSIYFYLLFYLQLKFHIQLIFA